MSLDKEANDKRQFSRTVSQTPVDQENNYQNIENLNSNNSNTINTSNSNSNSNSNDLNSERNKINTRKPLSKGKGNPGSIEIENELSHLHLETLDDLAYSLGIFENINEKTGDKYSKKSPLKEQKLSSSYLVNHNNINAPHQDKGSKSNQINGKKKKKSSKNSISSVESPTDNEDNEDVSIINTRRRSQLFKGNTQKTTQPKPQLQNSSSLQQEESQQILSIADSGIGIPKASTEISNSTLAKPGDITKTLQGVLAQPASIIYGNLPPNLPLYNDAELDLLSHMNANNTTQDIIMNSQKQNNKKQQGSKGQSQANGTVVGPSASRNHLPSHHNAIPGPLGQLSTHEANSLRSELITAVEQNKVDKVRRILVSGVDANAVCDSSGRWAKILLDYGAQKDQPDTNLERTPLLYAAASSPETVQVLLNYRADIKSRNKFGANALHYAAGAGQADCCKLLASSGCDVNARDRQKMTPLHMAARVDDIFSIEVLLEYGADIHARDAFGKSALHHAAETCEGVESDVNKMGATFRKLIGNGITVNACDSDGKTALFYAIQTGSPDAVQLLSDLGAELMDGVGLLMMSRKFPALIKHFLDKCVSSNIDTCDAESKHFYIQFDYTCLTFYPKDIPNDKLLSMQNREENESILQETGVLHGLTRCKDTSILSHPVCESLLRLKWKKVKWYLYLDMLLFALFLAFLTAVIFMEYESDYTATELDGNMTMMVGTDSAGGTGSFPTNGVSPSEGGEGSVPGGGAGVVHESHRVSYCMDSTRNIVVWSILWFLTGCLGVRELIQLIQAPLHYVIQIENMLELVLVFSVGMLSLAECGVESFVDTRDHFAAVCLIVGWTIQVTLYGKIPVFGVYIRMFAAVATNILKCMFTYLGLLFAFSLTLHFLFRTHKEFDSVGFTFLKTFAMMIGEVSLDRTFIDTSHDVVPFTSHVIFALFIIFISVILMSLLHALAVCDISKMQNEGEYMQLVQQVKVASQLEDALQHRSLLYPQFGMKDVRSLHQRKGVIFPNLKDHGKLSKDALEIVITQHTKKIDSSGAGMISGQNIVEHSSIIRATNEVADDLMIRLKNKMEKYAFDVEKRSEKSLAEFKGRQEVGTTQLNREVLLIKTLLEDMNTTLRELSITVKTLGERSEESSSSASLASGRKSTRSNDASTTTGSQTTSPDSENYSPEPHEPREENK